MRHSVAVVAAVALEIFAAGSARADKERVAVTSFAIDGPNAAVLGPSFRRSLAAGLAVPFKVVKDEDVAKAAQAAGGLACDSETCARNLGRALQLRRVVKARVVFAGTDSYTVDLDLLAVDDGRVWGHVHSDCAPCSVQEVRDTLENGALTLKVQLDQAEKKLQLEFAATNGAQGGAAAAALQKPTHSERPRQLRSAAIAAWVAGAVVLAGGVALLAVDGREGSYSVDSSGTIQLQHANTLGAGAALTALGPLMEVAGGLLWWRGNVEERRQRVAISPSPNGVSVSLLGKW